MPRVDNLLFTSDFDTLKNDDSNSALVVVPSSDVVAAGATATYSASVNVGEPESLLVISLTNNVNYPGGQYVSLSTPLSFSRTGSAPYSIVTRYSHTGGNTVTVYCSIFNNSASPLTLSATTDSFTFRIRTIKAPRFS